MKFGTHIYEYRFKTYFYPETKYSPNKNAIETVGDRQIKYNIENKKY